MDADGSLEPILNGSFGTSRLYIKPHHQYRLPLPRPPELRVVKVCSALLDGLDGCAIAACVWTKCIVFLKTHVPIVPL